MKNLSIHFSIKDQTIEEVRELYKKFVEENLELSLSLGGYTEKEANAASIVPLSERSSKDTPLNAYHVAHHCFLPKELLDKKNIPLTVPFFFEGIEGTPSVCWYGNTDLGIERDREAMIRNIKLSNGVCVFLGKIEGGVQIEYDLAKKWGCNIITVPMSKEQEKKLKEVKTWSIQQKKRFLDARKALYSLTESGEGGVCGGSTDVTDVNHWIADRI